MWDFLVNIVVHVGEFFASVYNADERPGARAVTIGCGVVFWSS